MTASATRRLFIAGSMIALTMPMGAVEAMPPDEGDDWGVFSKLAGIFIAIQAATNPIADGITRLKFYKFLNGIHEPLGEILREKGAVLDSLEIGTCTDDAHTIEAMASRSAQKIIPLVVILQEKVRTLSSAIKPEGTRQLATQLADELGSLQSRKMWVYEIHGFCGRSPTARAAFVARVKRSMALVQEAQLKLNALLDHFPD